MSSCDVTIKAKIIWLAIYGKVLPTRATSLKLVRFGVWKCVMLLGNQLQVCNIYTYMYIYIHIHDQHEQSGRCPFVSLSLSSRSSRTVLKQLYFTAITYVAVELIRSLYHKSKNQTTSDFYII